MVSASASKTTSDNAITGLTYVNSVIPGASANGLYSVIIEGNYMNDTMADTLRTTYGYKVTPKSVDMGSYVRYQISWLD